MGSEIKNIKDSIGKSIFCCSQNDRDWVTFQIDGLPPVFGLAFLWNAYLMWRAARIWTLLHETFNWIYWKYATTTTNTSFFVLLRKSPQSAKSSRKKGVLQTTPKSSCCTVALSLITSSQYHVMNCLIWFLHRLCMLDPIPASVLKNCYDLLLPFITKVVNCSLQNSTLTSDMKRAIVRPSLKKPSLDYQLYKNHRPPTRCFSSSAARR